MGQIFTTYPTPPTPVSGSAGSVQIAEVAVVNTDDGTIDAKLLTSRAVMVRIPIPGWYAPTVGERVLVADRDGDPRQPICLGYFGPPIGGAGAPSAPVQTRLLHARLHKNAFSVPSGGFGTGVTGWSFDVNVGGFTVTGDGVVHVPVAGWYSFGANSSFAVNATGGRWLGLTRINPVFNYTVAEQGPCAGDGFYNTFLNPSGDEAIVPGSSDGLSVFALQNSGVSLNVDVQLWVTCLALL